jgi:hypothetical protein
MISKTRISKIEKQVQPVYDAPAYVGITTTGAVDLLPERNVKPGVPMYVGFKAVPDA